MQSAMEESLRPSVVTTALLDKFVEVIVRLASDGHEIQVFVPESATIVCVRKAVAEKLGLTEVSHEGQLVERVSSGALVPLADHEPLLSRRSLLLVGVQLRRQVETEVVNAAHPVARDPADDANGKSSGSIKFEKDDVEDEEVVFVQCWKIVGGAGKGGIVVREDESLNSRQLNDRLNTGSLVQQIELKSDRLHYQLIEGEGPAEGWISTKLKQDGKELAVWSCQMKRRKDAAAPPPPTSASSNGATSPSTESDSEDDLPAKSADARKTAQRASFQDPIPTIEDPLALLTNSQLFHTAPDGSRNPDPRLPITRRRTSGPRGSKDSMTSESVTRNVTFALRRMSHESLLKDDGDEAPSDSPSRLSSVQFSGKISHEYSCDADGSNDTRKLSKGSQSGDSRRSSGIEGGSRRSSGVISGSRRSSGVASEAKSFSRRTSMVSFGGKEVVCHEVSEDGVPPSQEAKTPVSAAISATRSFLSRRISRGTSWSSAFGGWDLTANEEGPPRERRGSAISVDACSDTWEVGEVGSPMGTMSPLGFDLSDDSSPKKEEKDEAPLSPRARRGRASVGGHCQNRERGSLRGIPALPGPVTNGVDAGTLQTSLKKLQASNETRMERRYISLGIFAVGTTIISGIYVIFGSRFRSWWRRNSL